METALDRQRVRRCLGALTPLQAESVKLAYYGGYTYPQVAELLGVPLGTIKTRIRDGLITAARLHGGDLVSVQRHELHLLTGSYALDALPDDEQAEFEKHLARCPSCAEEVRGLRETAARLAMATAIIPPPEMRERVARRRTAYQAAAPGWPRHAWPG